MANQWLPQFTHKDLIKLEEKEMYSGYSRVVKYCIQHPLFIGGENRSQTLEAVLRPNAVAVLLYDPDAKKVVLIEQFRIGALNEAESPWLLEIVAGVVSPGEDLEVAARRETEEEAGCQILSLIPVCGYLTSPGYSNEKIFIYCGRVKASEAGGIYGLVEEGEDIKVHVLPIELAFKLMSDGKIGSSPTLIALQWLKINLSSLQFPQ